MLIHRFINHDTLVRNKKSLVLSFAGERHILSSSVLNGGFHTNLTSVFNFDEKPEENDRCSMEESTYEEHMVRVAIDKINLNPNLCSGLSTAADMENAVIEEMSVTMKNGFQLVVTAVVTGGIDKNGARAGDPACWEEQDGSFHVYKPGTINIFLHINAALTEGTMVRAVMTATEAKTTAVTELLCPSLYSEGLATGSGTDGIMIICDPSSPFTLTAAGKDSLLGEMIGKTVIKSLKKAIGLQTDVTPDYQHHVLKRLDRFGITEESLYSIYHNNSIMDFLGGKKILSLEEFMKKAEPILKSGYWTGKASFLAHLLDQLNWEMLSLNDAKELYPLLFQKDAPEVFSKEILLQTFCMELVKNVL